MPKTLNEWRDIIGHWAEEKGWNNEERSVGDSIALMHTELSEAFEEYRNGHTPSEIYYNRDRPVYTEHNEMIPKPEGIGIELVDCIIRIAHFAQQHNIDLDCLIELKHIYNIHRPYRHGNKVK